MPKLDLTNEHYGKLTVLYEGPPHITKSGNKKRTWICQCECGTIKTIGQDTLRRGHALSCGCLQKTT